LALKLEKSANKSEKKISEKPKVSVSKTLNYTHQKQFLQKWQNIYLKNVINKKVKEIPFSIDICKSLISSFLPILKLNAMHSSAHMHMP
jgi:hypothetical protein